MNKKVVVGISVGSGVGVLGGTVAVLVGLGWIVGVGVTGVGEGELGVFIAVLAASPPIGGFGGDWQLTTKNINPTSNHPRLNFNADLPKTIQSSSAAWISANTPGSSSLAAAFCSDLRA